MEENLENKSEKKAGSVRGRFVLPLIALIIAACVAAAAVTEKRRISGLIISYGEDKTIGADSAAGENVSGDRELLMSRPEFGLNIDESLDFEALSASEKKSTYIELNSYFSEQTADSKNSLTGVYEGYNVIYVLCESFSHYLIDEELTPALWTLTHHGFYFSDFYNTAYNNTCNSEYTLLTGMLPDESLFTEQNFYEFYRNNSSTNSIGNYLPYTLGNQLKSKGFSTMFFHYNTASYYNRKSTHKNFGFQNLYTSSNFYGSSSLRPSSDVTLIEKSIDKLKEASESGTGFFAYYLTYSGHTPYTFARGNTVYTKNDMALKNQDRVADLEYSDKVRAYYAGNLELESAMELLLSELDEAGLLENTIIAISPDHYPYMLGLEKLSELAGTDLTATVLDEEINKAKGFFSIYVPDIDHRVEVDVTGCTQDILPTLSNLLGLEYDSRLLMGTDLFSDGQHRAVLRDKTVITADYYYYTSKNLLRMRNEEPELSSDELKLLKTEIEKMRSVSNGVLYNDYFGYLYEQ